MADCTKYRDLISSYADGELSETEKAEIQKHLEECAPCRVLLTLYQSISEAAEEAMAEPPENFAGDVMQRIKALPENQAPEGRQNSKPKKSYRPVIISFVAAAACLALVFIAVPQLFNFAGSTRSTSSMPYAQIQAQAPVPAPAASAAASNASSAGAVQKQITSDSSQSESAQNKDAGASPQLMFGTSVSAPPQASATQAEPSAAPDSRILSDDLNKYYAVITVKGTLPDLLTNDAMTTNGDGTYSIEVSAETAEQLIKNGFLAVDGNKEMTKALVVYVPS